MNVAFTQNLRNMQLIRVAKARGLRRFVAQKKTLIPSLLAVGFSALVLKDQVGSDQRVAVCDASALAPPPVAIEAVETQSESAIGWLWNKISEGVIYVLDRAGRLIKVILRGGVLSILFFPSAMSSPVAILQSDPEWWWDLLRAAIRSSGPCFIKLSRKCRKVCVCYSE